MIGVFEDLESWIEQFLACSVAGSRSEVSDCDVGAMDERGR